MNIEDTFLEPCTKCEAKERQRGPVCKLHYALLFLHYLQLELERSYTSRSKVEEVCDNKRALSAHSPTGRQVLSTRTLFKTVKENWWRAKEPNVLYYDRR